MVGSGMSDKARIKAFILNNFLFTDDSNAIDDGASLIEQGVIDSTGILEVIAFLEETFSVTIRDEEMIPENFDSIDRIAAFTEKKHQK
jgi:acyl carrier protein